MGSDRELTIYYNCTNVRIVFQSSRSSILNKDLLLVVVVVVCLQAPCYNIDCNVQHAKQPLLFAD